MLVESDQHRADALLQQPVDRYQQQMGTDALTLIFRINMNRLKFGLATLFITVVTRHVTDQPPLLESRIDKARWFAVIGRVGPVHVTCPPFNGSLCLLLACGR